MPVELKKTETFNKWLLDLKDHIAKAHVMARMDRLQNGNAGDTKGVGDGVVEMRIDHGPGYRVYFKKAGDSIVILLCGGDKSTQAKDIAKAKELATDWK